jgi:hypothetical protein
MKYLGGYFKSISDVTNATQAKALEAELGCALKTYQNIFVFQNVSEIAHRPLRKPRINVQLKSYVRIHVRL